MKQRVLIILVLIATITRGQDMHFSQFYASPVYLNPAFAGSNTCARFSLIHRQQWLGFPKPYVSSLLSFDHYLHNKSVGVGFILGEEYAGNGTLKTTLIKPCVAYTAQLKKNAVLRFGLQPGIGIKSVDMGSLLFGDQIYRGGSTVPTVESTPGSRVYFDLSAGALISIDEFWGGVSLYHITRPNESLLKDASSPLPVLCSLHGGIRIDLDKDEHEITRKRYITPTLRYQVQKKFTQLDVGLYYTMHIFTLGVWYRGFPGLKAYQSSQPDNDAVVFVAGLQADRIKVGYSYDLTVSGMSAISKGAHEISLAFQLCNPKNRKTKYKLIYCPKF